MILGLSHMGLTVSNLDQSLKYYRENFGFKVLSDAERKGDWIDKMTGISGFHSRTVYLSVNSFRHLEIFDFINPKAIPSERDAAISAGISCCVFLREGQGSISRLEELTKREKRAALISGQEESYQGFPQAILEDPDGIFLKVIEHRNKKQDSKKQVNTDLLYPVFLIHNIARSLEFYQGLLGLKVDDEGILTVEPNALEQGDFKGTMRWALLGTKLRPCLKLIQPLDIEIRSPGPWQMQRIGYSHAAFGVSHLDQYYLELKEKGVSFKSPPQSVTIGPHQGGKAVYMHTPDGNALEFIDSPKIQEEMKELETNS
jgi:glyoxylase I family protein